ncbi:MAG: alginate lyase family protein [Bryobacter sp.]|nr:alginate lyase family protein [Bryobacter sp.]
MRALLFLLALPLAAQDPLAYVPRLEKNLKGSIHAFWYPRSIDNEHGGYWLNFASDGSRRATGTKMIVTQSRMVWYFARMYRAGYCGNECLEAAGHGYRFLREKMWDPNYGGFYWQVDGAGTKVTHPHKHLYGQSFALYAISEFALASGRRDVLDFATQFFMVLEEKAHDARNGGYREWFSREWGKTADPPYMGGGTGDLKLMNTHLHLMEAMTTFYRASRLTLARERLLELIHIEANAVVRTGLGACTDKYNADWTPRLDNGWDVVSYGHDLENVWLLIDAAEAAGIAWRPYVDLFRELWAYSLKYGYDRERGGFFYFGKFREPASNREKSWWVQAEALVSALWMYRITKDPQYWEVFAKTWDFVERYQTDHKVGEWHSALNDELRASGDKANPWKAAYHNGRAMIEGVLLLKALGGQNAVDLEKYLAMKPRSVMDKAAMPPSRDKHDYLSFGPYWWPDPAKPDGLPFIRRDGYRNREQLAKGDSVAWDETSSAIEALAEAWSTTKQERYARKAVELLRVWFLAPATRMNPHLNYGQSIPGVTEGRAAGLIDMRRLMRITVALGQIESYAGWTAEDKTGMRLWFEKYFQWCQSSPIAIEEAKTTNNHAVWFDAQKISIALYLGKRDEARRILEAAKTARIAAQIEPTGEMKRETARTDGWSYSTMNLRGFFTLARFGDQVGVDLRGFTTSDGRSLAKAIAYLKPFAEGKAKWPHSQLRSVDMAADLAEVEAMLKR